MCLRIFVPLKCLRSALEGFSGASLRQLCTKNAKKAVEKRGRTECKRDQVSLEVARRCLGGVSEVSYMRLRGALAV